MTSKRKQMAKERKLTARSRKKHGTYFWINPETGLSYARVQIPTGEKLANGKTKYKTIKRRAKNQTHAEQIAQEMLGEYADRGTAFLDGRKMTFQQLADWYKDEFLIEARYINGAKVAGMRTWQAERNKLERLCEAFGKMQLEKIDAAVLKRFKVNRYDKGVCSRHFRAKHGVTGFRRRFRASGQFFQILFAAFVLAFPARNRRGGFADRI